MATTTDSFDFIQNIQLSFNFERKNGFFDPIMFISHYVKWLLIQYHVRSVSENVIKTLFNSAATTRC